MRNDKEKALELRRKNKSYKEISRKLGIPTATLCGWFKDLSWSQEIKNKLASEASFSSPKKLRLMVAATKKKWALIHEEYRKEAELEFKIKKFDPLFISGVMLYWGEGARILKHGSVGLSNSDPGMIRIFYRFLHEAVSIPREEIFLRLLLYPDLNDEIQKRFWSKLVAIPLQQFKKSVTIVGRHPTKRLSNGVCNVIVHNKKLLQKILRWIELYQEVSFEKNAGIV
ncbi:MAG: hypothetical protein ABR875_00490 [Minisyncoccia bacterium]